MNKCLFNPGNDGEINTFQIFSKCLPLVQVPWSRPEQSFRQILLIISGSGMKIPDTFTHNSTSRLTWMRHCSASPFIPATTHFGSPVTWEKERRNVLYQANCVIRNINKNCMHLREYAQTHIDTCDAQGGGPVINEAH